jgi:hypothetical protein
VRQDKELVIDPRFFTALLRRLGIESDVRVELKRGRYANELSLFRYNVTILRGGCDMAPVDLTTLDWEQTGLCLDSLREQILRDHPPCLRLIAVRNARLDHAVEIERCLSEEPSADTVGDLRVRLSQTRSRGSIDPEQFWRLGEELSYNVAVNVPGDGRHTQFDVTLTRLGMASPPSTRADQEESSLGLASLVREPALVSVLALQQAKLGVDHLRRFLRQKLPEYMVPSAFVVLEALPLSPSGKIDRRALPPADSERPALDTAYAPAGSPTEKLLARIWCEVLGLDDVGIHDDFFDLGGSSIRSLQLWKQIERTLHFPRSASLMRRGA